MQIIGLIGGIASGKSLVAEQLVELGAGLLDADRAGHDVLELEEVKQAIRDRWGDEVIGPGGCVVRAAVGRRVFGTSEEATANRRFLVSLTHPKIGELLGRRAAAFEAEGKQVLVLDAPLLIEAGWRELCNKTIFVDAPFEVRLERAQRRGWTAAELAAREAAQEPLDVKRKQADVIVDNSGSPESTHAQVEQIWHSLAG